jgi:uncharacterized protein (DUF1697 family)
MTTRIALLRGINVGGNHRLSMKALVAVIEAAGGSDVRTYIQSGNAVFDAPPGRSSASLATAIRDGVEAAHGFAPHVLVRDAGYLRRVVDGNPYPDAAGEPRTLHVYFLDLAPGSPDLDGLEALCAGDESSVLDGDAWYLHAPDGIGRSAVATKAERLLGVPATARNWATVTALLALAED